MELVRLAIVIVLNAAGRGTQTATHATTDTCLKVRPATPHAGLVSFLLTSNDTTELPTARHARESSTPSEARDSLGIHSTATTASSLSDSRTSLLRVLNA